MVDLNIGLVAARRFSLLETTLKSFDKNLFSAFNIRQVRVNLDPIFGSKDDEKQVMDLIKGHFPQAEIRQPQTPGFTQAVQWIWSGMQDGPFLHLEDDWICLERIRADEIMAQLSGPVKMVSLLSETHGDKGRTLASTRIQKQKILGVTYRKVKVPAFNTSPGFVDGAFARQVAALFDLTLDPEKQMRDNRNPNLARFLSGLECHFHKKLDGGPIVEDIGRLWQVNNGVQKLTSDGKSQWVQD